MNRTVFLRLAVAVAFLGLGRGALAADTSYDLERLWLDPSARGSLVLGDGETLPQSGARLGIAGGWERAPLVLREPGLRGAGLFSNGHRIGDVVKDRWTLHLVGAVGITDRLELGLRVPITLSQKGSDLTGEGFPKLRQRDLGTISGMVRYGLTRQASGAPVNTALALDVGVPVDRVSDLDGNPGVTIAPRFEIGHRYERFVVGADVGANLRTHPVELTDNEKLHHEVTAGLMAATAGKPVRLEASLRGAFNKDGLGAHTELLGGVRWGFKYGELFALAGPGFFTSPGTPTVRGLVGLALHTPEPEAPAAEPAPEPAPAAAEPPPPPPPPDPCSAGQAHTPEQCPALDDDGDGIVNGEDRCPTVKGISELQGCPAVDTDGDGVADHKDRCPTEKGLARYDGCPAPDSDGDGITDDEDKCPDQPGIAELQGCPPARAEIKGGKIDIHEKVFFDTNKATVQQRSFGLLDDVSKLIVANPNVGKIRIEGHTDDRGAAALNRKLSQARADAVRDYLVARGVDGGRLETQGFGPDQPAQSNKTAAGREANRRVEFSILGIDKQ
jgi:OmpA-OmpF porin, OOP family